MYEQRDIFVPRKHHTGYRDRGNWGTTKTRNIQRVVYSFKYIASGLTSDESLEGIPA